MSCEGHRDKFFDLVSSEVRVQKTFGGTPAVAKAVMDQAFAVARSQMPKRPSAEQLRQAKAGCLALFAQFSAAGIKPPTHSPTGLPRRNAMFGYAAVYRALEAARQNKPLPALVQAILTQRGSTRTWSAVGEDAQGYYRCSSCGRFASRTKGHTCPITATCDSLNRALVRRLGVPASAFGSGNALEALLADARNTGVVTMRHNLTGERIRSTLDGLPLALATGFVPDAWRGQEAPVELADGRVVSVLDATGLTPFTQPPSALAAASAAYGLALKPGVPVASASSLPPVSYHRVRESAITGVAGGQPYDLGHFLGTEYRKGGSHG